MTRRDYVLWMEALVTAAGPLLALGEEWQFYVDWSCAIFCYLNPLPKDALRPFRRRA